MTWRTDKERRSKYFKEYRKLHKERLDRRRKERYYINQVEELKKARIRNNRYYSNPSNKRKKADYRRRPEVKERLNRLSRIRNTKLKLEILSHYSEGTPKCGCCSESELVFLTLDHINNDGRHERGSVNKSHFYILVKNQGFPPVYQVLCWNCNIARRYLGECPHKKKPILIAQEKNTIRVVD